MKSWLKRLRGTIGVGLTWAAGWGLMGGLIWLFQTFSEFGFDLAFFFTQIYAAVGFLGGVTFSAVLQLIEGRRRFDQLRIPRFAAWGAVGGFLIGLGWQAGQLLLAGPEYFVGFASFFSQFLAITTVFGALSAGGSLALARVSDDRELLQEGAETAEVGLSVEERRQLLGESASAGD